MSWLRSQNLKNFPALGMVSMSARKEVSYNFAKAQLQEECEKVVEVDQQRATLS